MDEGLDVSVESSENNLDVSADSDLPTSESVDIAELQNEAAALDIEPLVEENNNDYFEIEGETSHSLGERIAAGALALGAPFAAGIESAAHAENTNTGISHDIPAIYEESPHPFQTLEQAAEQFAAQQGFSIVSEGTAETQPSALQTAGELAGTFQDIAQAVAEGQRLRDNAEGQNDG